MMIKNFYSTILSLYVFNSLVYDASGSNYEIELVQDINPNGSSKPRRLERLESTDGSNNQMFFIADDGIHSTEPWISNGTSAGTNLLKDIRSGVGSGLGSNINAHGKIYFVAHDGITGEELWLSDGTSAGTKIVKDIFPGSDGSNPRYMCEYGTNVYFFARSSDTSGMQLWKTDGTDAKTMKITNMQGGFNATTSLSKLGNLLIFASRDENNYISIWKVDGETLSQITTEELGVVDYPGLGRSLTAEKLGKVYFSAASASGVALYYTDGSIVNKIKDDIEVTRVSRTMLDDQRVLFVATSAQGSSVWVTDGTAQGTKSLLDELTEVYLFPTYDGKTLFIAGDSTPDLKMYSSDGTVNGTKVIYKFDSTKELRLRAGSKMGEDGPFFWGMDFGSSFQIWFIEGSDEEPKKLREFVKDTDHDTYNMDYLNNATILFDNYDSNTGVELWKISKISKTCEICKTCNITKTTSSSTGFFIGMGTLFSTTMLFSLIFI